MSLTGAASNFLAGAEFQKLYGSGQTDTAFISALYQNVLHRAPDAAGTAYWVGQLQGGLSRATVLASFSESSENQSNVIGIIQNGVPYTEWPA
jgi:hypothetical protein